MRVLLAAYGSRGDVGRWRTGAAAPPEGLPWRAAGLVAAQFGTVAAAAEGL